MKRLLFGLLVLAFSARTVRGGRAAAVDSGRQGFHRCAGRHDPADPDRMGPHRKNAHRQRRAPQWRPHHDQVRRGSRKAGARDHSSSRSGLHCRAARDICRQRVAVRHDSDHADDDGSRGSAAAQSPAIPDCKADFRVAAQTSRRSAPPMLPGMMPELPDPAIDQINDPAIAAAAAAGLMPVPAHGARSSFRVHAVDDARRDSAAAAARHRPRQRHQIRGTHPSARHSRACLRHRNRRTAPADMNPTARPRPPAA